MLGRLVVVLASLTATAAGAVEAVPHDDEVRIFATAMAIARTVRDDCETVGPDDDFLERLRLSLHVADADRPAFAAVAHAAAEALLKARGQAPSPRAWCDTTFRLYGPNGKLMPGMLRRREKAPR